VIRERGQGVGSRLPVVFGGQGPEACGVPLQDGPVRAFLREDVQLNGQALTCSKEIEASRSRNESYIGAGIDGAANALRHDEVSVRREGSDLRADAEPAASPRDRPSHLRSALISTNRREPHIKTGRVRALAVTSLQRSSALPEVPTVAEAADLRGYEAITWQGFVFPHGTPKPVVDRMYGGIVKVLAQNEVVTRLRELGYEPVGSTPQDFAAYIKSEIAKWAKVIAAGNIKAE